VATTTAVGTSSKRLGAHHFAYLRAVAEGVPAAECAARYLAIDHRPEARQEHRLLVERVRALARRRGDPRWRLIGLDIRDPDSSAAAAPPLHEWAEREGLGDWSEAELLELYHERFGVADEGARRRLARNERLRQRRLHLLRELEAVAAERAAPTDLLGEWLPPSLVEPLQRGGDLTLADLQRRIARGGRWWAGLPAFGPVKAQRLAALVELLVGPATPGWPVIQAGVELQRLSGRCGANRVRDAVPSIEAVDDRQAIRAWIAARAGSPHTAKQYEREAERFLLWCVLERRVALSDASAEDCRAYMDFLANVPERWMSRRKVARLQPGWAPFKGPLKLDSQRLALEILASLFAWLVRARYLVADPWTLVNRKLGDDAVSLGHDDEVSRAFTPAAWAALHSHLERQPPGASVARLKWLCVFVECTGLRAAELLRATRADLVESRTGWVIRVHGKGRRNRTVPVPAVAMQVTLRYFESRGLDFATATGETPLLGALSDAMAPIGYRALYETFTRFVRRAVRDSDLPPSEKERALRASAHWLRHTHATRAAERKVPPDVLQENLGQADPRTTARYYRAQMERRQRAMEKAFGDSTGSPMK
jgi:integrase